jgi:titin
MSSVGHGFQSARASKRLKHSKRGVSRAFETLEQRRLLSARIIGNATVFATIQAAVDAAAANAVINVDPGTYSEQVTVAKTLTIRGAGASIDARSNARQNSTAESVVNGFLNSDGTRTTSFYLNANNIVLDGFTIEGQTSTTGFGAAVHMSASRVGIQVLNNIVQNNATGVHLSNNSASVPLVVRGNLFRNNNQNGPHSGRALYSDGSISGGVLQNVVIDNNAFVGNKGWDPTFQVQPAIGFEALLQTTVQTNIRVTNNIFDNNGKHFLAYNASNITIQGNWFQESWDTTSAGIRFEGGVRDVLIRDNNIYGSGARGLRIDRKGSSGSNYNFTITNNNFFRNGIDGGAENAAILTGESSTTSTQVVLDGPVNVAGNWWGSSNGPGGDWGTPLGSGDKIWTRNAGNRANVIGAGSFATSPVVERQGPFWGTPSVTNFNIQFEDQDQGGSGVAYNDTTSSNSTGALHHYEGVDLQTTTDTGGGYSVGTVKAGEWLEYTMNVTAAGTYTFQARVASSGAGGNFHLEINGVNISGTITVPNTGSSSTWQTISKTGVNLPAGTFVLRVAFDTNPSGGSTGNFNWFKFVPTSVQQPPNAPSNALATAPTPTKAVITWTDNSTDENGFIVERRTGTAGNWGQIGTTGANVTTIDDLTVVAGTQYFYRVRAFNNTTGQSNNSNEAQVTTPVPGLTYLSDLQWVGTPLNGWGPVEKDMSVGGDLAGDGNTITLNGVTYTKGLGVHADADITYNLGGNYTTFLSDVGVDDETGAGSVRFQVFLDGSAVAAYDSGVLTQAGASGSINLNVTGAQTMLLRVTNGGDNYSWDHADWAGARLLSSNQPPATPAAPTTLAATAAGTNQIDLTWADNSNNETAFILERSLNGTTGWQQVATPAANVTSISDTLNLSPGTQYFYRIRATNSGSDSANSNVANATTSQPVPTVPAAPSNLVATAVSTSQINLTWADNSNNETGFIVERSLNGVDGWTSVATPAANATSFNNTTGLNSNTKYYYRVRATNGVGDSANSNTANATTQAVTTTPTFISTGATWKYLDNGANQGTAWRATAFDDSTWKSGAAQLGYGDGDEATVVGFGSSSSAKFITTYFRKTFVVSDASLVTALTLRILRDDGAVVYLNGTEVFRTNMPTGTISNTTGASSAVEDTTFYTSTVSPALLVNGNNVIAVEIHQSDPGSSDISFDFDLKGTASAPSTPPAAPSTLVATAAGTNQINLTWADNSNNETGFIVERSLNGTDGWQQVATPAANATSISDTLNLSPGTQYFYRARATNSAGPSSDSNTANATTAAPTAPAAPSSLVASAVSQTQINLTWVDNSNNETGFIVERSLNGTDGWMSVGTPAANATSFNNTTGLSAGTQYFYRVRATNGVGDSGNSNTANATTSAAPTAPAAPGTLAALAVSSSQINLTWVDNSNNETGFIVERSLNGTDGWTSVGTPAANATSFNNTTGLSASTQYFYRVRATNGVGDSGNSNVANATTSAAPTVPAAPSNLLASAVSSSQINLTWTDNATDETGFIVERSADGVNGWTSVGTPAANATSFNNTTGLSASTQYFYRVRATNGVGPSTNSNTASATTQAAPGLPAPWVDGDIGTTGAAGSATFNAGTYTVKAAGTDVWGTADGFNFLYQPWTGDGQIICRVTGLTNTSNGASAGVMIRQSLAANSAEASIVVQASTGIGFVRRTTAGGSSTVSTATGAIPQYLKLIRAGNSFTAFRSTNGTTWTQVGAAVTINMTGTVYFGLSTCSQVMGTLTTGTYTNVTTSTSTSSTLAAAASPAPAAARTTFSTTAITDTTTTSAASTLVDSIAVI